MNSKHESRVTIQDSRSPYFIGIDVGTQGARVVMMDSGGNIVGNGEEAFVLNMRSREEQSPLQWWDVCERLLRSLVCDAKTSISIEDVKAIAVTSTSGTVIPLDRKMQPLHNAIMYSDPRSGEEGKYCRELSRRLNPQAYTGFNASSGLSKIVWFVRQFPTSVSRIARWVHASDYITGRLCGVWDTSDYTNVLKSGYDVRESYWPSYLFEQLHLRQEWFSKVVPSGTPVGNLSADIAQRIGLPSSVVVVAGMTDGCASQIASGAVKLGDWNTTIGTTLVVKGVTEKEIKDPLDRLYSHRHPEGYWMPGGAGNIGADWITSEFANDVDELNEKAAQMIPTKHIAYPLRAEGERFPFIAPQARGFQPQGVRREELFTANLEGVAYVERYAFDLIESLSGEKVKAVYTAGGGSKSDTWLTIRSNVLGVPIYKMRHVSGAVGAAILAASKTLFSNVIDAANAMTQIEKEVRPSKNIAAQYNHTYNQFISLLQEKGYIQKEPLHA
jgi:sugar (pentulose or hexulose) kinase